MNFKNQLGKRIRELRISRKYTQEYVAEVIGIKPENYSRIENGFSYPKPENLMKICNILNISISELFKFEHLDSLSNIQKYLKEIIENDEPLTRLLYKFAKTIKE